MTHNPNVVLLGVTLSTVKEVTAELADPVQFPAGVAVRRAANGGLQLADNSVAALIGVSLGASLSDTTRTAVCRKGNFVPIRLKNDAAGVKVGNITFTSKLYGTAGNALTVALLDTLDDGTANVEVMGDDIVIEIEAGVTTALAIQNAIVSNSEANALVTAVIDNGQTATAQAAAAEVSLTGGSEFAIPGTAVKIDDVTGEASIDGDTTAALYLSGTLTGIYPDGTTVPAALIALPGGF